MIETEETTEQTLTQQLRRAMKDGVYYLGSMLTLLQARAAEMARVGAEGLGLARASLLPPPGPGASVSVSTIRLMISP